MITQAQLAKELGVSQQAVSFALNGTGTLAQATRDRILEEAARLGYRKNMASITMQTGKTRSVGLLVRGAARSLMPHPLIMGITSLLEGQDHTLSIVPVSEDQLSGTQTPPVVFREHRVDGGLVLLKREYQDQLLPLLNQSRMPWIWINEKLEQNAAYPDDLFLGHRGAEILLEHGCKKIAYLGPHEPGRVSHYSEADRFHGYQLAMKENGMEDTLFPWRFDFEKALELLTSRTRPDGFLCYGSKDADNIFIAATKLGIRIPEDLKILVIGGAGDSIGSVQYAVLRVPIYQVGIRAMEMLEERIDHEQIDVASAAVRHEELDRGHTLF